ncbi:hypothetical protein EU528_05045, partial [Candidatus Thorarchaeota archaeon]
MSGEEDSDLEIYGTSPGVIAFFMILISLIVPLGVLPMNAFIVLGGYFGMNSDLLIYSLLWAYSPGFPLTIAIVPFFIIFNIWFTLPLTMFNIAYIWKIIRYYRGDCTRYSAIWVGMLSLTVPTVFALLTTGWLSPEGGLLIIGPIPIQFIVGLFFMYKIPGPEMTSPWRGDLVDRYWWTPKRPDWWD